MNEGLPRSIHPVRPSSEFCQFEFMCLFVRLPLVSLSLLPIFLVSHISGRRSGRIELLWIKIHPSMRQPNINTRYWYQNRPKARKIHTYVQKSSVFIWTWVASNDLLQFCTSLSVRHSVCRCQMGLMYLITLILASSLLSCVYSFLVVQHFIRNCASCYIC